MTETAAASHEATAPPLLPTLTDLNRPFWEGGLAGELRFQRCDACGHLRYPISTICPRCLSPEATWTPVSGRGAVLTYAVFHRAYHPSREGRVPYVTALVQLDEGPRMFGDLVGAAPDEVSVGIPVEAVFEPAPDGTFAIPRFRLTPPEAGAG
jgi:uncharacterized OB-fold protein